MLVAYLTRRCDVLTLAQLTDRGASDRLRVVLSFDDGCRDFLEYAMPILQRYRVRANHNVIAKCVTTERPPWIIAVMDALNAASTARVRALEVPGFGHALHGDDASAKVRYGTLLARYLKAMPPNERAAVCADVNALLDETDPHALTTMMSVDDVRTIMTVHELGGHSFSHESMAYMTKLEFADDVDRCAALFSSLGQRMNIFAFPNGSYCWDQVDALRHRGVEHVLLVEERASTVVRGVHPRITIYGDTAAELRLRAMGCRPPLGVK